MTRPRLFLIDTYNFIFRAYHARARTGAPPMRTSTGQSTEAVFIFHNMLRKLRQQYNPDYITAIWESSEPTFRSETFAEYKANRSEMPEDLGPQIGHVRRLLDVMRIKVLEFPGYEADDVIGAITRRAEENDGVDVVIVSSDKDMLQLITDRVSMYNPMKDDAWYDPAKTQEFMGVPPANVADLLALKGDAIDNIPGAPGIGDKGARDLILRFGSVEAALDRAAEVERKMYRESLLNNRAQIEMSKKLATIQTDIPVSWCLDDLKSQDSDAVALRQLYKEMEFFSLLKEMPPVEVTEGKDYGLITSADELDAWLQTIPPDAPIAIALDGTHESPFGLAWQAGTARAVPQEYSNQVRDLLEDPKRTKIAHDVKSVVLQLRRLGMAPAGFNHDVMLYAFLLTADSGGCGCDVLAEKFLDRKLGTSVDQRADCSFELFQTLRPEVESKGFQKIYDDIDYPLIGVLERIERCGIRIATEALGTLSEHMDSEMRRLATSIFALSGHEFNINSPQQLGKVLYEELKLPAPFKYGKGKTLSTAADILEALAAEHEVARLVLDYRQIAKLKGTYVDALPALIDPATGRVHTTFNQTGAATGRLSSTNPNLQNIPIRTELGREIRAAFIPEPGWNLVIADYSQIELRLLAHFSGDKILSDAFRKGEDIHTRTASEVFGVAPLMVDSNMRRSAKAVNFGIVYGQTPFGLATTLGIEKKEAERYINNYFDTYKGVRDWIDDTIAHVRRIGVSHTLFGRERPIPDMNSRNPNARGFAERTAVNTPLQGTAADLIKLAMIRIDDLLRKEKMQSRMLLQVHDELVFEAPPEETPAMRELIKREMEGVADLRVPLVVDVGVGSNWRDAK